MGTCEAFVERCMERFGFLERRGLVAGTPWYEAPRACGLSWRGTAASVDVSLEIPGVPGVVVRPGDGSEGIGLHEARPLLDADAAPLPEDPLACVDVWAAFLRDRWSDLLDPALLARVQDARERERQRWCGAFFDEAREAFAFLADHGYAEPLPVAMPTQCSLAWHAPPRWVLVHRTDGRDQGVWIHPGGDAGHFDLAAAMPGGATSDLRAAAAFLRAHPELLGGVCDRGSGPER